jgi:hypothetical protein
MTSRRDPDAKAVQIFVSSELHELWARQAKSCNSSMTGFVKSQMPGIGELKNTQLVRKDQQVGEMVDTLAMLRLELKRIGNNLNQGIMVLNSHALYEKELPTKLDLRKDYADLEKTINEVAREIRAIGESFTG